MLWRRLRAKSKELETWSIEKISFKSRDGIIVRHNRGLVCVCVRPSGDWDVPSGDCHDGYFWSITIFIELFK
jgi:hypothetical protein